MSAIGWPTLTLLRLRNAGVALVVGLAFAVFFAASALAVAPGVTIDPGSPAGQQYAFPLSVLRGQGAGNPAPGPGSTVPLFGVGVTPATRKTASVHTDRRRRGGGGAGVAHRAHRADAGGGARAGRGTRKVVRSSAVGAARLESPRPSRVPVLVALVLVVGVGLGVGLRALGRRG
jgi:hypothetical protein